MHLYRWIIAGALNLAGLEATMARSISRAGAITIALPVVARRPPARRRGLERRANAVRACPLYHGRRTSHGAGGILGPIADASVLDRGARQGRQAPQIGAGGVSVRSPDLDRRRRALHPRLA